MHVIPAVIPQSRHHLDRILETIGTFTDVVQIDIVDGIFAEPASWPYTTDAELEAALAHLDFPERSVEFDLMINDPHTTLDMWLRTGAERLIVHVESTEHLEKVLAHRKENLYELGLSFNNDTSFDLLYEIDMQLVAFVQLMGIAHIGVQGQPFDERVLERTAYIKKEFPKLPVSIDGSVNMDTITKLRQAGAERFVSGSAILKASNPQKVFGELTQLARGGV